ncbi:9139_t:CDS:2, partial [Racocetra persica]
MENFSTLIKFCQENICNVSKFKETCKEVRGKKSIFGNNNDKNKIFDMCDKIFKDPGKSKQFIEQLESQLSTHIEKVGAYVIKEVEEFEYPVARIIAAQRYPNIEMTT